MRTRLIVASFMFAISCSSGDVPKGILPLKTMTPIVYDLIKADEWTNGYLLKDSSRKAKATFIQNYEQVFAIYKIDKETFYKSYRYYQQHPDLNKTLFDSLHAVADRQQRLHTQKTTPPQPKPAP